MKINEIIKKKRKEKNMTQETLAGYLGVTAPAVNKWEKGSTYPDITLLPPLARVLGTDLNTLLSFKEDLTETEIGGFINELGFVLQEKGFDIAFFEVKDRIRQYPSSDLLIMASTNFLVAALSMADDEKRDDYSKEIEELYERLLNSNNVAIQTQAKTMSIGKYLENKEFNKAEELINTLPDRILSKEYFQAEMYIQKQETDKALELFESSLLFNSTEMQAVFLRMIASFNR